jgi:hypothetical protein
MKLNELFNKPLEWQKIEELDDFVSYAFHIDDEVQYTVEFSESDDRVWELAFAVHNENGKFSMGMVNTGGKEIQIFSTIKDIVSNFLQNHASNIDKMEFSSDSPSRTKLYRRLAKMIGDSNETYYNAGASSFTHFSVSL